MKNFTTETKNFSEMPYVNVTLMDESGNAVPRSTSTPGFAFGTLDGVTQAVIEVYPEAIAAHAAKIESSKLYMELYSDVGNFEIHCNYNFPGAEGRTELLSASNRVLEVDVARYDYVTQNPLQIHLSFIPQGTGIVNSCVLTEPTVRVVHEVDRSDTATRSFALATGVEAIVPFPSGEARTVIAGIEDPALGITVSQLHLPKEGEAFVDSLRTSLDETLTRRTNGNYVYTDSTGKTHDFGEIFYTVNGNGERERVTTGIDAWEKITTDADGRLWYEGREIFHERLAAGGLRAVTRISDFNDSEWLEQRYDEEKEVEEQLEALEEHLCEFALMREDTGAEHTVITPEMLASTDAFEEFLDVTSITEKGKTVPLHLLTKDEALSYRSMLEQKDSLSLQFENLKGNVKSLLLQLTATESFDYQSSANALQRNSNTYEKEELTLEINEIDRRLNLSDYTKSIKAMEGSSAGLENSEAQLKYYSAYILNAQEETLLRKRKSNYENRLRALGLNESKDICNKNELCLESEDVLAAQIEDRNDQIAFIKEQINNFPWLTNEEYTDDPEIGDGLLTKQYASVQAQLDQLSEQMSTLLARSEDYREDIPKRYTEYLSAKKEAENVASNVPVAFILSDDGARGYNKAGRLITVQSKSGKHIAIEWDTYTDAGDRRLTAVSDEEENRMTFYYDESDRLQKIVNSAGDAVCFTYEENTLRVTHPYLPPVTLIHENNRITTVTENGNDRAVLTYDPLGRLATITESTRVNKIAYGSVETDAEFTEREKITLDYDGKDVKLTYREAKREEHLCFDAITRYPSATYTVENGVVTQAKSCVIDILTEKPVEETAFATDSMHQYPYATFAENATPGDAATYEYDRFHHLVRSVASHYPAAGQSAGLKTRTTTEYTYNAEGKPTLVKATTEEFYGSDTPTKTIVSYESTAYNSAGNPVRVESYTEGKETVLGKDITEIVYNDEDVEVKRITYNTLAPSDKTYTESETDEKGRTLFDLDVTGKHKTEYSYFADGSLAAEHYPSGGTLAYAYDKEGNTVSVTASTADGEGNTNVTHYTAGLVTRVESGNHVVDYEYDGKRRLTKIKLDGADYETYTYTENEDGSETVAIRYAGSSEDIVISKNAKGDITNLLLGNFANANYNYTPDGRVTDAYDSYSLREMWYSYDSESRMDYEEILWGAAKETTYDEKGRVSTRNIIREELLRDAPENHTIAYAYTYDDDNDRLASVSVNGTTTVTPAYGALGRSTGKSIRHGSTLVTNERIDYLKHGDHATVLPQTVRYAKGNAWTDKLRYTYDCMGNITAIYEDEKLVSRYEYDALNRLAREDNRHFAKTKLFFYDNCGNITARHEYAFTLKSTHELTEFDPVKVVEYKYDGDRLVSYDGNTHFTYNAAGFATRYRGKTLTYTPGKHLALYDRHGTPLNRFYDGSIYGGGGISQDKDGNILSDNNFRFLYDDKGIMGLISRGDETTYYYRRDAQGNVIAILDTSGNVVVEYKYDAWGACKILNADGSEDTSVGSLGWANPIRYRGYYYDNSLGLYYLTTRYYDPETGRFTSADDSSYLAPDTINGLNLYAYCNNNPVMNVDPDGHWSWKNFWQGVVSVVATVVFVAAIVASAGAVGALAGAGAAALGLSAAAVSTMATVAVASTYVVATGVGLFGLSDSIEAFTSGFNPIRDSVMGGNQELYTTVSGVFRAAGTLSCVAGMVAPKIFQSVAKHYGSAKLSNGSFVGSQRDFFDRDGRWSFRIDATTHGNPKNHHNPHYHVIDRGGPGVSIHSIFEVFKKWLVG